jgi:raffinose/stachyose/melibiose transport system permease protein
VRTKKRLKKAGWIAFFVTPALGVVFAFILLPLFMSLFNSLFSWNQLIRSDYTGFRNFERLFFTYPYQERFFNALGNNVKWFVLTMIVQNGAGLLFGYVLSKGIAGSSIYRRIFFIPVLFSIAAVGFLWGLYLRPNGMVNALLQLTGLGEYASAWLGNASTATYSIIIVNIWRWVGFPSLVFLTAINSVPSECTEAAYLDGSSEWQMFRHIVFPLIIPSVTIITILTVIGSLNVFEQVYTMAGLDGAPNYATDTIGTLFYRTAFGSVDSGAPEIGIGSAVAVVIYVMTFGISLFSIMVTRSREVEM